MKKRATALVAALSLLLTGCGGSEGRENALREGEVGDLLKTAWFGYTVQSAQRVEEYQDHRPEEGEELVVVELTMNSVYYQHTPMSRYDFQLYWEGITDLDLRCYPLPAFCEEQLPDRYTLEFGDSRTGTLVYEVPEGTDQAVLVFQEFFDDDTQERTQGSRYLTHLHLEG